MGDGKSGAAPVNRIVPLSAVDGPGARTAIFLQGCNIACLYCHNPETWLLCRHCGACVAGCPTGALRRVENRVVWAPKVCVACDACLKACPHHASPRVRWMTPGEVMEAVLVNRAFIRGITVSGGECTLYPDFLTELFTLAKREGLSCLIDSNGTTDFSALPGLMAVTDGVMLDVKAWDPAVYKALTGAGNDAAVKRSLSFLHAAGKLAELRVVYLPGHVDATAVLQGAARVLGGERGAGRRPGLAETRLKLIAFRPYGVCGAAEGMAVPTEEEMEDLRAAAETFGFGNITVV